MSTNIPEGLFFTEDHEWVQVDGEHVSIGITDFAQSSLGDIVFVELPEIGTNLDSGSTFGVVESIKSVSDLYTPVSGEVIEKNDAIEGTPESINDAPYDSWLVKLKFSDKTQLEKLMNSESYKTFCENA
jgi:glycine cleavage system H protein